VEATLDANSDWHIPSKVIAIISAAHLAVDGFKAATINWQTFSQAAFAFTLTPQLLVSAIIWARAAM